MYKIYRKYISAKGDKETELLCAEQEFDNLPDAIFELEKQRKADRAMYRLATKHSTVKECDDYVSDTYYSFHINNITIEGGLMDAEKYAYNIFGL